MFLAGSPRQKVVVPRAGEERLPEAIDIGRRLGGRRWLDPHADQNASHASGQGEEPAKAASAIAKVLQADSQRQCFGCRGEWPIAAPSEMTTGSSTYCVDSLEPLRLPEHRHIGTHRQFDHQLARVC